MTSSQLAIVPFIVGRSDALRRLRELIGRFARTDIPVLIHGPTGTGKELVARAIHQLSGRTGTLVAVNVCAVADTMVEDALFGHVRGAFTGAVGDSAGFLAEANGGTLFLDEVGGLSLTAQVKSLRALESGAFRPVGATRDRMSNFRIVSATNEDVAGLASVQRFRADLLHRLGGVVLTVPSLRQRTDDIPDLVEHFLSECAGEARPPSITPAAIRQLLEHDWPGNVRELRHVVRRACVFAEGGDVTSDAVARALSGTSMVAAAPSPGGFAKRRLLDVLERCDWDTAKVASELGVHRATVYRRMERLGVTGPERGEQPAGIGSPYRLPSPDTRRAEDVRG